MFAANEDAWGGGGGGLDNTIGSVRSGALGNTHGSNISVFLRHGLPGAGRRRYVVAPAPAPAAERASSGRLVPGIGADASEASPASGTTLAPSRAAIAAAAVAAASERSRTELDALLRTHQGEMRRCLDRWLARQEAAIMSDRPAAEEAQPVGVAFERQSTLRLDDGGGCVDATAAGDGGGGSAEAAGHITTSTAVVNAQGHDGGGVGGGGGRGVGGGGVGIRGSDSAAMAPASGSDGGPGEAETSAARSSLRRPPPLADHLEVTDFPSTQGLSLINMTASLEGNSLDYPPGEGSANDPITFPSRLAPPRFAAAVMGSDAPEHKRWQTAQGKKKGRMPRVMTPLAKRKATMMHASATPLLRLIRSPAFELFEVICIVLNAIFIVCETEIRSRLAVQDPTADGVVRGEIVCNIIADTFFIIWFLDLGLRIWGEKRQFFFTRERAWNVLDVVVVVTAFLESIARWHQFAVERMTFFRMFAGQFVTLRMVRVLRIVRGTRTIRVSPLVRELSVMVTQLTSSLKPLAWSVVLLVSVLLMFGVFFADGVSAFCIRRVADGKETPTTLHEYFDSLFSTTVTLFMAITGGIDWVDVWDALKPMPSGYRLAFLFYLSFVILALLNVITAVFVQAAVHQSQRDRELLVQQEVDRKAEFIVSMQRVFEELDANGSGTLTLQEFERQLEDENILNFLCTLELDIDQVRTLLTLLDRNQNGEVDIEEFIQGCLRLKGGAKSLDLAILQYQVEWILHNTAALSQYVESRLDLMIAAGGFLSPGGIVV